MIALILPSSNSTYHVCIMHISILTDQWDRYHKKVKQILELPLLQDEIQTIQKKHFLISQKIAIGDQLTTHERKELLKSMEKSLHFMHRFEINQWNKRFIFSYVDENIQLIEQAWNRFHHLKFNVRYLQYQLSSDLDRYTWKEIARMDIQRTYQELMKLEKTMIHLYNNRSNPKMGSQKAFMQLVESKMENVSKKIRDYQKDLWKTSTS